MSIKYYRKKSWIDETFSRRGKMVLSLLTAVVFIGLVAGGCGLMKNKDGDQAAQETTPVADVAPKEEVNVPSETTTVEIGADDDKLPNGSMVSYDVMSVGRADPFMPYGEIEAFEDAKRAAYAEANAHNAKIAELNRLKGTVIRQADDISPYSFNLPVPPTSLASEDAAAAKITRTKVVGIMFNSKSPSAIINVDDKDYLVRQGDKIIGQEYKVMQINPSWITVGLGSNIYSASIGELFAKDELDASRNDLYNLKNRFGGRKG